VSKPSKTLYCRAKLMRPQIQGIKKTQKGLWFRLLPLGVEASLQVNQA